MKSLSLGEHWVSTHLTSPSLGRVEGEERGFGERKTARKMQRLSIHLPSPETRKLVPTLPREGGFEADIVV